MRGSDVLPISLNVLKVLMKRILSCAVFLLVLQGFVSSAKSETHERVTITPWKSNGKTIGFNLKLVIRPTRYTLVRVGLGKPGGAQRISGGYHSWRNAAAGVSGSYILKNLGVVRGVQTYTNQTVSFRVKYSDVPKLKPGSDVEVVTAWDKGYWHIHGAATPLYSYSDTYRLPNATVAKRAKKKKKAQPRARKKKPKTAKRRAAKKKPATAKRSKAKKKPKVAKRSKAKKKPKAAKRSKAKKKPATAKRSKTKKKPAAKKSKGTRLSKLGGKSKASKNSKAKAKKGPAAKPKKKAKRVARRR